MMSYIIELAFWDMDLPKLKASYISMHMTALKD